MEFAAFGCSLDVLDAPEKVGMKLAYMAARAEGIVEGDIAGDPLELLLPYLADIPGVETAGRLEIESALTPRPLPEDVGEVNPAAYRRRLDTNLCLDITRELRDYVRERVFPMRPLLVGVDHSLSGGVLEALSSNTDDVELAVIVLDSHFDAIPTSVRREAGIHELSGAAISLDVLPESYNCGTWIRRLIEDGIVRPENLVVVGVSDHPGYETMGGDTDGVRAYRDTYLAFEEKGVRIVPKKVIRETGIEETVAEALDGIRGQRIYVSIDSDIGAGAGMSAVRFLDTIGLSPEEAIELSETLASWIIDTESTLAGLDVMEIDVHLADLPGSGDRTAEICSEMIRTLTIAGGEPVERDR